MILHLSQHVLSRDLSVRLTKKLTWQDSCTSHISTIETKNKKATLESAAATATGANVFGTLERHCPFSINLCSLAYDALRPNATDEASGAFFPDIARWVGSAAMVAVKSMLPLVHAVAWRNKLLDDIMLTKKKLRWTSERKVVCYVLLGSSSCSARLDGQKTFAKIFMFILHMDFSTLDWTINCPISRVHGLLVQKM
jgi:hypothetical protein